MPEKGRAYTMKELKGIVEYLVSNKAYGEIRGRKMWLDFASTGFTSRTWQSLKETFLKRILPDIHNPYYKLSKEEIRSFRMGQDVTNNDVDKLQICTPNADGTTRKDNNTANGEPSTSHNVTKEEGDTSGEEKQVSKVTSSRESVDTVILSSDECYNNAQELLNVLESPAPSSQTSPKKSLSLRDCITYSEPLTPMLQEILDDFQTDTEDAAREPEVILEETNKKLIFEDINPKKVLDTECIDLTTQDETGEAKEVENVSDEQEKINNDEKGLSAANEKDLSETNEKPRNLSTDDSDMPEVQNAKQDDINKNNSSGEDLSSEKDMSEIMQEPQNTVPEENNTKIIAAGVQEVINSVQEEKNKDGLCKSNQKPVLKDFLFRYRPEEAGSKDRIFNTTNSESNTFDVQVIENDNSTKNTNQKETENDKNMNGNTSETQNAPNSMQHLSSTVTDSLIPNNQEALLNKSAVEEPPEKPQDIVCKVNSKCESKNSKTENVKKKINKKIKKVFIKSHKRQRKLYSTTESIALAQVKNMSIDESSELLDNEQPEKFNNSILDRLVTKKSRADVNGVEVNKIEAFEKEQPSSPKKLDISEALASCLSEKRSKDVKGVENPTKEAKNPIPLMAISNDQDGTQQDEDVVTTQESHQSTNPCLLSVSLFDEQLLLLKSDSDDDITNIDKSPSIQPRNQENVKLAEENIEKQQVNIIKENSNAINRKSTSAETYNDPCLITNRENVVVLHSRSESETTEDIQLKSRNRTQRDISRSQKKEVLNDLFGNASGAVSRKRRKSDHRNGSTRRNMISESSQSSEWLSESDNEYVSPPRARNRQSKRYFRPQSSRLLQMRHEGALFVAVGRKVYPLVRDDGQAVNYVSYVSGSESEDDSYWKLKYVKERKKNEQLSKQLEKANDACADRVIIPASFESPILPSTSSKKPRQISIDENGVKPNGKIKGPGTELVPVKHKEEPKAETVKIKFAKNNEEIFVEGHWQNVHTILSDVMQVFKRDSPSKPELQTGTKVNTPSKRMSRRRIPLPNVSSEKLNDLPLIEVSSGKTTPSLNGEEVRMKVDQLERKIFEEIEEKEKSEKDLPEEDRVNDGSKDLQAVEDDHVTERKKRGRPTNLSRNSPLPASVKSSKRTKTSSEAESVTEKKKRVTRTAKTTTEPQPTPERKTRRSKTEILPTANGPEREARSASEGGSRTDSEIIVNENRLQLIEDDVPVRSKRRVKPPAKLSYENPQSRSKLNDEPAGPSIPEDDSQTLYKFPSPPPAAARGSRTKKYLPRTPKIYSSSDNTQNSVESSQGYQDSDLSPQSGNYKRRKKCSLPIYRAKELIRYKRRRRTFNAFECDASSESSNSSYRLPLRNITVTNSSLNTEVYRSESYQLLVPKQRHFFPLEKISESPCSNEVESNCDANCLKLSPASQRIGNKSELGNSSSMSLPLSPELSIVEHISFSKDDIEMPPDHPTINETFNNVEMRSRIRDNYVISKLDVSVPLMQQKCNFHVYQDEGSSRLNEAPERQDSVNSNMMSQDNELPGKGLTVSESLLDRMDTASIEGSVTTNDLDVRLTNLLLESAKKIASQNKTSVQINSDGDNVVEKKQTTRKRCSTPRKKKGTTKVKTPIVEPVIEECMEFCSSGRKSCPPVLCENSIPLDMSHLTETNTKAKNKKPKSPKEIIRVKIQKPKKKDELAAPKRPRTRSQSRLSVLTDSGITADTSLLQSLGETVDFIHNHSDTCLNGHDCLSNSEECIANTPNADMLVDSSFASTDGAVVNPSANVTTRGKKDSVLKPTIQAKDNNKIDVAVKRRRNVKANSTGTVAMKPTKEDTNVKPKKNAKAKSKEEAAAKPSTKARSKDDISERKRQLRESMTPDFFCCDAQGASSLDKPSESPLKPCPTQTQYHSAHCSSLMTEDLSDEQLLIDQSNKWYLLSEDENSNTLQSRPASCSLSSSYSSNLRQLFPVVCAVPDLSDITEFSKETDGSSLKSTRNTDLDSNMRSEFFLSDFQDDFGANSNY